MQTANNVVKKQSDLGLECFSNLHVVNLITKICDEKNDKTVANLRLFSILTSRLECTSENYFSYYSIKTYSVDTV